MKTMSDFVVKSKGYCFLCLNKTSHKFDLEDESQQVHSLRHLSLYLKMDMTKVFNNMGPIPQQLVSQVEMSNLKVELCKTCACWNRQFSKLHLKLEKIKFDVMSHLNLIRGELTRADMIPLLKLVANGATDAALTEKLGIAEALRTDAIEKYSRKIGGISPRIKIQKLTKGEVLVATQRSKPISENQENFKKNSSDSNFGLPNLELGIDHFQLQDERADSDTLSDGGRHDYQNDWEEPPDQGQFSAPGVGMDSETHSNRETIKSEICQPNVNAPQLDMIGVSHTDHVIYRKPKGPRQNKGGRIKDESFCRFECKICGKKYARASTLDVHNQKIHLKVRFQCGICSAIFTQKNNLDSHMKSVHLGERYKCKFCSRTFSQMANRARHMKKKECMGN